MPAAQLDDDAGPSARPTRSVAPPASGDIADAALTALLLRLLAVRTEAMPDQLVIQSLTGDPEGICGSGDVAAGLAQGLLDDRPLDPIEALRQRAGLPGRGGGGTLQVQGEALGDVLELAHVAGPVVLQPP